MRAEPTARTVRRRPRERPPPGIAEHPGRQPRPNPDRPSVWRCEHPSWRQRPPQMPRAALQRAPASQRLRPVFQSAAMQNFTEQASVGGSVTASSSPESVQTFASVVRHELVNPLNALSGWLHLLAMRPPVSEEITVRALAGARRAVDQQLVQIEMLSRVLQLSVPGASLDTQPVSLRELTQACCADLTGPNGEPVRIRSVPGTESQSDDRVRAHREALAATLSLLLGHVAQQGTPQAHLDIEITAEADQRSLVVRVAPALPASESTLALPWAEAGALQTRSLEWLHALAVMRALGARVDLLQSEDPSAGIRMTLPAPDAQTV